MNLIPMAASDKRNSSSEFFSNLYEESSKRWWNCEAPSCQRGGKIPWLMLQQEEDDEKKDVSFLNLEEKRSCKLKEAIGSNNIVGSSHGWLLVFDQSAGCLFLQKPFTGDRIELPPLNKIDQAREKVIKAVVSSDPFQSAMYGVVVLYGEEIDQGKLALFKSGSGSGEEETWMDLYGFDSEDTFLDIVCCNNNIYATTRYGAELYVWNMDKCTPINPGIEIGEPLDNRYSKIYLVESETADDFFLLELGGEEIPEKPEDPPASGVRIYKNKDGTYRSHKDFPSSENHETRVYRKGDTFNLYTNFSCQVCKYVSNKQDWEAVQSLGDRVFFAAGNHAVSFSAADVPGFRKNSIYIAEAYQGGLLVNFCTLDEIPVLNNPFKICPAWPIYHCDSLGIQERSLFWVPQSTD